MYQCPIIGVIAFRLKCLDIVTRAVCTYAQSFTQTRHVQTRAQFLSHTDRVHTRKRARMHTHKGKLADIVIKSEYF